MPQLDSQDFGPLSTTCQSLAPKLPTSTTLKRSCTKTLVEQFVFESNVQQVDTIDASISLNSIFLELCCRVKCQRCLSR